jgi:hypothetical protein
MTWSLHNRVVHPVCAVMRFLGMKRLAMRLHDQCMPDRIACILWDLEA